MKKQIPSINVALHRRAGRQHLLDDIYDQCKEELKKAPEDRLNRVQGVYEAFPLRKFPKK